MEKLIKRLDSKIAHYSKLKCLEEEFINKTIDSQPDRANHAQTKRACYSDFIKDLEAIKSEVSGLNHKNSHYAV